MTAPTPPVVPAAPEPTPIPPVTAPPVAVPASVVPAALVPGVAAPLHEDPAIAKALEGLTEAQRATLLTTGGKNALDARGEEAKTAKAAAKAAETARAELAQTIGKALGLVTDEADPAKLAEQLTAQTTEAKQAKTELAVFHAAAPAGVNAARLLDSRTFMTKVAALEPADTAGLTAAITEALAADPTLALTAAPGTRLPLPSAAPGSSGGGSPDAEALIAAARKSGDWQTVVALENQKLVRPSAG